MSHLTEIPIPDTTRQALAVLRDERDTARREAVRYKTALMSIEARAFAEQSNFKHDKDAFIALGLIANIAHRALQLEGRGQHRTWRDRLSAWWMTRRAKR